MSRDELERLSKAELIDLVLRLQRPEKTSRTSSKPPATDRKEKRETAKPGGAKPGHEGHSRALSDQPDRVIDHRPQDCPGCGAALAADLPAEAIGVHEQIELPPIKPVVEHHRRLSVRCPRCGRTVVAPAAHGTPFGPRLHAVATYLKTFQALSYERLQGAFAELFGLTISQGGLMNVLRRAQGCFRAGRDAAVAALRRAVVVASDETGVRVEGATAYHWVFRCEQAVVHQVAPTRAASVVHAMMAGHRPQVWRPTATRPSRAMRTRSRPAWPIWPAMSPTREASEDDVPWRLELWLGSVFDLARGITTFASSTIARKRRALEGELAAILTAPTRCDLARDLQGKFRRAWDQLLTFTAFPGAVDVTNNGCERDLRPSVVQCKVTNGYRSTWAAEGEADVRTVVDTARLGPGPPAFSTILKTVGA